MNWKSISRLFSLVVVSIPLAAVEAPDIVQERAPRLDAPLPTSPLSVVVPSLDVGAVLQSLSRIRCKIGNVNQAVCEDTILSVLGDACGILGISISQALAILLDCCDSNTFDLSDVFTVLQDIENTINSCCDTLQQDFNNTWTALAEINTLIVNDFNGTWTMLNALSDTQTDCCATLEQDFQDTWTILSALNTLIVNDFNSTWTMLNALSDTQTSCCATLEQDFQDTWTILSALNTLIVNDFNGTWTQLTDIKNTMTTDFQDTWTILAALNTLIVNDFNGTWTQLTDIKNTMTTDFQDTWTILSTLTDCCSTMTTDFQDTWTILAALNTLIVNDFNGTWTQLTDIKNTMTTDFQNTWTILAALNTLIVNDFNGTWTQLTDIKNTMTTDFQDTWTILSTLTDCCSTMTTDFQDTWTILADLRANYCNPTFIYQSNFAPGGQTPLVISSPGVYKLAEDITYNPSAIVTTAITINSSDVTLDLQCFTLSQGTAAIGTTAIAVSSGMTDVEIRGGRIENFSGTLSKALNINTNVSRFYIHDISCINIANPIVLNTDSEGIVENISVAASTTLSTGISMSSCTDVAVKNIAINQSGSSTASLTGVSLSSCTRCTLENINIEGNTPTSTFIVFNIGGTTFCVFKNVSIVSNTTASTFTGFNLQGGGGSDGNEFYNCVIANNQTTGATGLLSGFLLASGSDDNLLVGCEAYNNSTLGTDATSGLVRAFYINANTRNTLRSCIARDNTAPNATIALSNFGALGFVLDTSTNCLLQSCLAEDQDTGGSSNAVGFYVTNGSNNVLQECQSFRQDFGYRLDPALSTSHVFLRNVAAKNTTNYSQFPVGSNQTAADISAINASLTAPWTNVAVG